jgi:hypothetical protein
MLFACALMAGVFAFLRFTRFGRAMRAVADDADLARLKGIDPKKIAAVTITLSAGLVGMGGVLLGPRLGNYSLSSGIGMLTERGTGPSHRTTRGRLDARMQLLPEAPVTFNGFASTGRSNVPSSSFETARSDGHGGGIGARLLPGFDEYLLGYRDRSVVLAPEHSDAIVPGGNGRFKATIVADGEVIGTWGRRVGTRGVVVEAAPFARLSASDVEALGAAADGYGRFLGRTATTRVGGAWA